MNFSRAKKTLHLYSRFWYNQIWNIFEPLKIFFRLLKICSKFFTFLEKAPRGNLVGKITDSCYHNPRNDSSFSLFCRAVGHGLLYLQGIGVHELWDFLQGTNLPSQLGWKRVGQGSQRLCTAECVLLFNSVCANESLLPNYSDSSFHHR